MTTTWSKLSVAFCFIEICQMPKDEGKCNLQLKRYYFDPAAQECREFAWFGCRGNKNNFETLEHCETRCASYRGNYLWYYNLRTRLRIRHTISYILKFPLLTL